MIKERPKSAPQKLALNELVALRDKIEKIKSKSTERRLERIVFQPDCRFGPAAIG
jgi:hypothetical protein